MSTQLLENYQMDLQQLPLVVVELAVEKQAFEEQLLLADVAWTLIEGLAVMAVMV